MKYKELVDYSHKLKSVSSRNEKIELIIDFLKRLVPEERIIGVNYIAGIIRQGKINIGWSGIQSVMNVKRTEEIPCDLKTIDAYLEKIKNVKGSEKLKILSELFARMDESERKHLASLILGEIEQGAGAGMVKLALAKFFNITEQEIEDAYLREPDLGIIYSKLIKGGKEAIKEFKIKLFTPVRPMLAESIEASDELFRDYKDFIAEYKFDGIRIQVHRQGDEIKIYSRHLQEITDQLPEIIEVAKKIPANEFIIDGEAVGFDANGMPLPFQILSRRTMRKKDITKMKEEIPIQPRFFDLIYIDGQDITAEAYRRRHKILKEIIENPLYLVPHLEPKTDSELDRFLEESMTAGNEGLMIKMQESPYQAGKRRRFWLKLKPAKTIDCVILGAEWGHGRRRGWLSNLHLGILDETRTRYLMVGKTFKGLTDDMLRWLTENLLKYKVAEDRWTVYTRPEIVIEVAFNEVQKSPKYDSGYALRFARVKRIRNDKMAKDVNTIIDLEKYARIRR
ncbi:MAG: ATP-dependent DNA ligase [candidate division WOR-3 bacterium]|nr:ATP-dependent DNA ligase [candidate division WOR-3 bacterium]